VGTKISLSDLSILPFDPKTHDVSAFDCGDSDLNEFLQKDAQEYQREHLSFTRVVFHDKALVAYVSLSSDSIVLKTPEKKKLVDFYASVMHWPALKIGRLAVVSDRQRKSGIGKALLQYAVAVALRMGDDSGVGCRFLTVDAYPVSIDFYQRHGFVFNKHYVDKESRERFETLCQVQTLEENSKTHPSMRYDFLRSAPIE
jgi:GNAT superfamily N-acetyltransferase